MKLKCNKCEDIIEGDKKGTYITCKCRAIAIDETPYYTRYIGNAEDIFCVEENKQFVDILKEQEESREKNDKGTDN